LAAACTAASREYGAGSTEGEIVGWEWWETVMRWEGLEVRAESLVGKEEMRCAIDRPYAAYDMIR